YSSVNGTNQFDVFRTGNNHTFASREISHRNFTKSMVMEPGEVKTIYLMIVTGSSVQIPLTIWDYNAFHTKSTTEYLIFGSLIGLSIVMALYNLFLFVTIRDRSYLYYVIFVTFNTLLFIVDTGFGYQYIWPNLVSAEAVHVTELMFLSNIAGLLFIRAFLLLDKRMKRMDDVFKFIIVLNIIAFIIRQFTFTGAVYVATVLVLFSIILIIFASAKSLIEGFRPARYLLLAWGLFLLGVLISLLVDVSIIPLTTYTKYAWQMTTALEVILLSFALGDR